MRWTAMLVMVACPTASMAADLGVNLLVNPDAEAGDMTGWTPTDTVEVVDSEVATEVDLPPGESIGDWCFTGATGELVESCSQTVDVSDLAAEIDAGGLACTLRALLQDRSAGGATDTVTVTLTFLDEGGGVLGSHVATDPSLDTLWDAVESVLETPVGTRSLVLQMTMERNAGVSTDAFADNLELVLGECAADCDGNGALNILDFVCFQGEFQAQSDAGDCDGNGLFNILDFVCYQGLFVAGCP